MSPQQVLHGFGRVYSYVNDPVERRASTILLSVYDSTSFATVNAAFPKVAKSWLVYVSVSQRCSAMISATMTRPCKGALAPFEEAILTKHLTEEAIADKNAHKGFATYSCYASEARNSALCAARKDCYIKAHGTAVVCHAEASTRRMWCMLVSACCLMVFPCG